MAGFEKNILRGELIQRREEGCDVSAFEARIEAALTPGGATSDDEFATLYEELSALEVADDFPFHEPSTLTEIRALRPDGPRRMAMDLDDDELKDRIYGAWLGRSAGCVLGKPVEGWPKARIDKYLEESQSLPLDDYLPFIEGQMPEVHKPSTRGNIVCMPRDDDLDYSIIGLLVLETRGVDFTPRNMANVWLSRMPYHLVYTAESAAYRNFVNQIWPPESAAFRNPAREWIGAQIRADAFGWVAPGWPEKAAELAFRDASISHVKNGIYGEMMMAAMISAAFVTTDIDEIIDIGLSEIPANCRLAEAVHDTRAWCRESDDWESVFEKIAAKYGHMSPVHTINNAALVVAGLYFGKTDFGAGIVTTVRMGWDTDCTAATVGSILGARNGNDALPDRWTSVLNDRVQSAVQGCADNRISDLAERTFAIAKTVLALPPEEARHDDSPVDMPAELLGKWELRLKWGALWLTVGEDVATVEQEVDGEVSRAYNVHQAGTDVRFSYEVEKGGWSMEMNFIGRLDGDTLMGEFTSTMGEWPVTGSRVS